MIINCVQPLATADPNAEYLGIKMIFNPIFNAIATKAMMFNFFKFPFAVSNVPKIYVADKGAILSINIRNTLDDSKT